jgi:hypothetical protein
MIQSILIDKNKNTLKEAEKWIKEHNYIINKKPSNFITKNYYRFRQIEPEPKNIYAIKTIDKERNIKLVLIVKKN